MASFNGRKKSFKADDDHAPRIPSDLVTEILKRLEPKSLVKFRAVCKSWRSIIESPEFVSEHHHHQYDDEKVQKKLQVLCMQQQNNNNNNDICIASYVYDDEVSVSSAPSMKKVCLNLDYVMWHDDDTCSRVGVVVDGGYHIVGYSCGIFCIFQHNTSSNCGYTEKIMLWNPSLGGRTLSLPDKDYDYFTYGERRPNQLIFGIGGVLNNDLRELKVVRAAMYSNGPKTNLFQTSVFSLSSRTWRSFMSESDPICHDGLKDIIIPEGVHVNGVIYWLVSVSMMNTAAYGGYKYSLLSFNLEDERFSDQLLDIPEELNHHPSQLAFSRISLQSLRKETQLGLFARHRDEYSSNFTGCDYWVMMMMDKAANSWVKLFTLDDDAHNDDDDDDEVLYCCIDVMANRSTCLVAGIKNWFLFDATTTTGSSSQKRILKKIEPYSSWLSPAPYKTSLLLLI